MKRRLNVSIEMGIFKEIGWLAVLMLATVQLANADTVVILGGHVPSLLHPVTAEVETFGPCGIFESGLPPLPEPRREFAAAQLGSDIVYCGGYQLAVLGGRKDCLALNLEESPMQWRTFPPLNDGRYFHSMLNVGGDLYVIGGSALSGSVKSIERYNTDTLAWEVVGQEYGFRLDSCALPWKDDGIMLIGGYDEMGGEQHVELFNTTTLTWSKLANLNTPRSLLACANYQGGVVAGGGWTPNFNDPDYPTQDPTKTDEWYDPLLNTWTEMSPMRHRRTDFALAVVNNSLIAIGGYEGYYVDTIEYYREESDNSAAGWSFHEDKLKEGKSSFAFVLVENVLEDPNCV